VASNPLVGIVIINWRGEDQTSRCLDSLSGLEYAPYRVCVVDNGSADGSAERLSARYPSADVISLPDNGGYAAGCNAGIEWAEGVDAEYVWLLNNDTTVEAGSLKHMVDWCESRSGAGSIVAPKIVSSDTGSIWSAGGVIRRPWFKADHIGLGEEQHSRADRRRVEWASGCSLFFSRSTAHEAGPMDERYFLYLEDADWCLRAARKGIATWYVPDARVHHEVSATTNTLDPRIPRYYAYRNYYLLAFAHSSLMGRIWFAAHLIATLAKIAFRSVFFTSYRRDSYYHARTRAIADFLLRRFGKAPFSDYQEPAVAVEPVREAAV